MAADALLLAVGPDGNGSTVPQSSRQAGCRSQPLPGSASRFEGCSRDAESDGCPEAEPDAYALNQRANPSTVVPMPMRSRGSCHNPEVVSSSLFTRTSRTPPTYP